MTGQPLVLRTTDLDAHVLNPEVLWGRGVLLVPPAIDYRPLGVEPTPRGVVLDLLQDHRRVQNVRSCSGHGCSWRPEPAGRTGDPDAMRRRHAQFNAHLADLIRGCPAEC